MKLYVTNVIISGSTINRKSTGIVLQLKLYRKTYFPIAVETSWQRGPRVSLRRLMITIMRVRCRRLSYIRRLFYTRFVFHDFEEWFTRYCLYFVRTKLPEYCLHNFLTYPVFLRRLNAILQEIQCFNYISESSSEKHEII